MLEDRCLLTFVTTLTDNVAGSLRNAIATATAVGGDGLVEFAPGLTGTITLNAGVIPINANVTINGPGPANVTVNANNASRVFNTAANNLVVNISGLKIQGGNSAGTPGGAILVNTGDTLNITNCWLTGNTSGAGTGGALQVQGNLNMTGCTVSGNTTTTGVGGGILLTGGPTGTYRFVNCTITGNTTTAAAGGGVVILSGTPATFINCTVFNNTAGGGAQGGGIGTQIAITLLNTIVSGNTAGTGPDILSTAPPVLENFSLVGNTTGFTLAAGSGNNQNGQAVAFGPLQANGGMTPTLALTGTSATNFAIGRGTGNGVPVLVDQRDLPRGFNAVDIGAFQTQIPYLSAGTQSAAVVLNTDLSTRFSIPPNFYGAAEIRTAMGDVNGDGVPDLITVAGPGGGSVVGVFDGVGGALLFVFPAITTGTIGGQPAQAGQFGTNSSGTNLNVGFFVAAGDIDADGFADVVIGFDGSASGPLVNIFSGKVIAGGDPALNGQGILASYNSFPPPSGNAQFNGGVRVAAGDFDNDGSADVLAVPGIGGGPLVSVYSGQLLETTNNLNNAAFIISFNAYPINGWPGTGLFVAIADVDHDGWRDIILGPGGTGGATALLLISGRNLLAQFHQTPALIDNAVVGAPPIALLTISYSPPYNAANGIRVAAADVTGDGFGDIILGGGPSNGPTLQVFQTNANAVPTIFSQQSLFNPLATTGLFVGGGPV